MMFCHSEIFRLGPHGISNSDLHTSNSVVLRLDSLDTFLDISCLAPHSVSSRSCHSWDCGCCTEKTVCWKRENCKEPRSFSRMVPIPFSIPLAAQVCNTSSWFWQLSFQLWSFFSVCPTVLTWKLLSLSNSNHFSSAMKHPSDSNCFWPCHLAIHLALWQIRQMFRFSTFPPYLFFLFFKTKLFISKSQTWGMDRWHPRPWSKCSCLGLSIDFPTKNPSQAGVARKNL